MMKTAPSIVTVKAVRPDVTRVFVACEQDGSLTAYALVKAHRLDLGAARPIVTDNCAVRLISIQSFELSSDCVPGDIIWLNNQHQILVSIDGSPLISVQDDQLKALRRKIKARIDEIEALKDERDKPRQEQEKNLRIAVLRQEEQLKINQQERELQEVLHKQAERTHKKEAENKWKQNQFIAKIALRRERLNIDALRLAKYPELIQHAKQVRTEQDLQAIFNAPGLQYTLLLEIELNQIVENELKNLAAFRKDATLLENLDREQKLQEARRLQQEQITKQEEAEQQQKHIDWNASQYQEAVGLVSHDKALEELADIKQYVKQRASSHIIRKRAVSFRLRCEKSKAAVTLPPESTGGGATTGAIIGGLLGIFGGPVGIAAGAAIGGVFGSSADQKDASVRAEALLEIKQWATLISDIDELLGKLP